jgi:Fur family transcriptional regulator, ferric uptake regulator
MINRNQRHSRQREIVLEELQRLKSHPSAVHLYQVVAQRLPKISLGTIYRNLEVLVAMGLAQRLEAGGGEARFDGDVRPHDHVRCTECNRIDDIPGPALDLCGGYANDLHGYEIVGRRLEFLGLCPACRQRMQGPSSGQPAVGASANESAATPPVKPIQKGRPTC